MKYLTLTLILTYLFSCSEKKELSIIEVKPAENVQIMEKEIPNKSITIEQLEKMYSNIKEGAGWDMSKPMLWGYFFVHNEPKLLEKAKAELVSEGYRFVNIYMSEKDDPKEPDLWWLHVEKEEIHATPESLDKRNNELYIFADKMKLDRYDGMDVGTIEIKK